MLPRQGFEIYFLPSMYSLLLYITEEYKPLANISTYLFSLLVLSLLFLCSSRSSVCCCAILTTGTRARRDSPRSMKVESSKIGIEKFYGNDFDFLKMQIKDYL